MQTLSGFERTWKCATDPKNIGRAEKWFTSIQPGALDAPVPGNVQQVFENYHGVAWYWHAFTPAIQPSKDSRCILRFGAAFYLVDVWLNGVHVGGHEGGDVPFQMDVTEALQPGKTNLLAVRIVNVTNSVSVDGLKFPEIAAPNGRFFSGLFLPVELVQVPAVRIEDVFAQPDAATGQIDVLVDVVNDTASQYTGTLQASAGLAMIGEVEATVDCSATFPKGKSTHKLSLTIQQPRLWSLEDPQLYRVTARLGTKESNSLSFSHEKSVRCGFRDFRVVDGYFQLNGKRIFLRSLHTAAWFPSGSPSIAATPALSRQDMILAKAGGFNMVRFIAGAALPEQLDCCDEIGLMIYEEPLAAWELADSPHLAERYDSSLREMILRDRNHACITIWGLLNETVDSPTFRHALKSLPLVRSLDKTRLVLLSSGRFDSDPTIGSVSNPGGDTWEYVWGAEGESDKKQEWDASIPGLIHGAGDVHMYPKVPQTQQINDTMRSIGKDTKPVFLSEYGIGSMTNAIREVRNYEQAGLTPDPAFATGYRNIEKQLLADWKRFEMDGVYPFPEDMLIDSQRLHCRQRLLGFDIIRSNPKYCGFSMTSMLDSTVGGEGTGSFWREPKPGIIDTLRDGWAALRWCLFVEPMHVYAGRKFTVEAVLANEDVLAPGEYPVVLRICGSRGIVWEKKLTVTIPAAAKGQKKSWAINVFRGSVKLDVPSGEYTFAASMERNGAPAGGRLKFHVTNMAQQPRCKHTVTLFGIEPHIQQWLTKQGVRCRTLSRSASNRRDVILVGNSKDIRKDTAGWRELAKRMARGSTVLFLSDDSFRRTPESNIASLDITTDDPGNVVGYSFRDFPVANVSKEEQSSFNSEIFGRFNLVLSDLPNRKYRLELGMCEGYFFCNGPGMRLFDVLINGKMVLENFDIFKEAGGINLAVLREFDVQPKAGKITIQFINHLNGSSVSRIRLLDEKGNQLFHADSHSQQKNGVRWQPMKNKIEFSIFDDWLYHKECVAKAHPIFEGLLSGKGIMDWDFYGPVISRKILDTKEAFTNVIAAAFAVGYCNATGYASGIMMAEQAFGKGRFLLNTFNILDNIDKHPAADRLLLNMLNYAAEQTQGPAAALPANFTKTLNSIGYGDV